MNAVSLFSGIGGLDYGLARAGFRHLLLCESDPWRRSVLRARFPGVPVAADVCEVDAASWAARFGAGRRAVGRTEREPATDRPLGSPASVDLVCGGFPCQDLSVAGRRAGLAGERSGLFFEYARIVDAFRPRWLLVENVPGLLSSNGGRDFGIVLGTLADLGYGLAWRVLDSRFFGVPQRRRRVFVLGAESVGDPAAAAERAGEVLAVGSRCSGHPATRGEAREDLAGTLGGGAGERGWAQDVERMTFVPALTSRAGNTQDDQQTGQLVVAPLSHGANMAGRRREDDENLVAYSLRRDPGGTGQGHNTNYVASFGENMRGELLETPYARALGGGGGKPGQGYSAVREGASVRRLTPVECERLQGLPDNWTNPHGDAPDSRRYAGLGDAVTATVAEWIGRRIIAADQELAA